MTRSAFGILSVATAAFILAACDQSTSSETDAHTAKAGGNDTVASKNELANLPTSLANAKATSDTYTRMARELAMAYVSTFSKKTAVDSLNTTDRQTLATIGSTVTSLKNMTDALTEMSLDMATSMVESFAPSSGRVAATSCILDTSFRETGATYAIKITNADGSAIATCSDATSAYASPSGLGIQMKMTSTQGDVTVDLNMKMVYRSVGTGGGYSTVTDLDISITGSSQGQTFAYNFNPMHFSATAANATVPPVIDGYMTFTIAPFTIEKLAFDGEGLKAQSTSITKGGTKVAVFVVDAKGNAVIKDLDGKVIEG